MRGVEVIEHLRFASPGHPYQLREFLLPKPLDSVGDIARCRTDRITELIARLIVAPEVRRQQEQVDAKMQLMRQSPGGNVANVVGAVHAVARCNRVAA